MKKLSNILLLLIIISCSNDDDNSNTAPQVFNLLTVEDQAKDVPVLPAFSWEEAIDPDQGDTVTYDLYLDQNTSPTTVLAENITNTTYEILEENILLLDQIYYWKVVAKDNKGARQESAAVFSFETTKEINNRPGAFNLLTVEDQAIDVPVLPTFSWEASKDPDQGDTVTYDLYLDQNTSPTTVLAEDITNTTYEILEENILLLDQTYYWKVVAKDNKGARQESAAIFSFETTKKKNNPPETFNLLTVEDQAIDVPVLPAFSWEAAIDPDGDPVTYDLILESTTGTKTITDITTITYTLTEEDKLELDTAYSWKVVAKDDKDAATESASFSFTTRVINEAIEITEDMGARFTKRIGLAATVFNGKIWVVGGFGTDYLNDVWSSNDGIHWVLETDNGGFSSRSSHNLITFNDGTGDKMYLTGGRDSNGALLNDVWSSTDGKTWEELEIITDSDPATPATRFSKRSSHQVAVFDDGSGEKLWVIGGTTDNIGSSTNDIWVSADGQKWDRVETNDHFSKRSGHQAVVFDNKIWVTAGLDDKFFKRFNDVWSSSDGKTWTEAETSAMIFSERYGHQTVVFDNKLLVMGGTNGTDDFNDIWYTRNGADWIQAQEHATFSPRVRYAAVVFQDKIWVFGGYIPEINENTNEIWVFER